MTLTPAGRQRFYLLDGLRLCAALAVVLYHYTAFKAHSAWGMPSAEKFPGLSNVTAFGALGVHLFFVISGFVIVLSAQGCTVQQFAASRVSRLYPAYWVAVVAAAVLYLVIDRHGFKDVSAGDAVVNLTMMQEAVGASHLDGVYWTLWVELLFYVMIALVIPAGLTAGKITAMAFLWPVTGAIAKSNDAVFLTAVLNPSYAPFFAGGMVLYLIHAHGHSALRWLLLFFNVCLGVYQAGTGWVGGSIPKNTGTEPSNLVGGAMIVGIFAVVALVTVSPLKHRGPAWLTVAGALTYPLYLVHEAWGWFMIQRLHDVVSNKWLLLSLTVAVVLIVAWLINRFVEKPVGPWLNKALKRGEVTRRSGGRRVADSA